MADPGVPVFRGESGSDCEEFIRAVSTYAFERDKAKDDEWIATYAGTRLSGKALRWYVRQDKAVKLDWSALQVALLDQYPPSDEEDLVVEPKAQPLPKNVPTPAAAAAPAPTPPLVQQVPASGCKKARIRVEEINGTVKGWISMKMASKRQITSNPGDSLHVIAEKVNSGPTTLWIQNADRWSRLGIRWSHLHFDDVKNGQSGRLRPCDATGAPTSVSSNDALMGELLPEVWDINEAGIMTPTWQDNKGKEILQADSPHVQSSINSGPRSGGAHLNVSWCTGDWLFFESTKVFPSGAPSAHRNVMVQKLIYEPIE